MLIPRQKNYCDDLCGEISNCSAHLNVQGYVIELERSEKQEGLAKPAPLVFRCLLDNYVYSVLQALP